MAYYTGSVAAVSAANKEKYAVHVRAAWKMLRAAGAVQMVETWGVDVPKGELTDFHRAVDAREDEVIVLSWITWPDRETADAAWKTMRSSTEGQSMPTMPLDGKRMIYGGFEPLFDSAKDQ